MLRNLFLPAMSSFGQKGMRAGSVVLLLILVIGAILWIRDHEDRDRPRLASAGETRVRPTDSASFHEETVSKQSNPANVDSPEISESDRQALQAVEEALRGTTNEQTESILYHYLPELLSEHGSLLVERLLTVAPPGFMRETLLRVCAIGWPRVDPDAAVTWAAGLSDPSERQQARERVLTATARVDPEKAVRLAAKSKEAGETGVLTEQLVGLWAAADFRRSCEWAVSLPTGEQRDRCVARVAAVEAQSFPADAARFALERLPSGPALDETIITIVYYWTARDRLEARRWVESFPEGALRERALQEINGDSATATAYTTRSDASRGQ